MQLRLVQPLAAAPHQVERLVQRQPPFFDLPQPAERFGQQTQKVRLVGDAAGRQPVADPAAEALDPLGGLAAGGQRPPAHHRRPGLPERETVLGRHAPAGLGVLQGPRAVAATLTDHRREE